MNPSILYSDTPENFYQQIKDCVQQVIQQELAVSKKDESEVYLKKDEVCKMLQLTKPTVESHVKNGFYKKYYVGGRVFFNKQEIVSYLRRSSKTPYRLYYLALIIPNLKF